MSDTSTSRRDFLKAGALVAAPLAGAVPVAALAADAPAAATGSPDEHAIRAVHAAWLRHVHGGEADEAAKLFVGGRAAALPRSIAAVGPDPFGAPDRIEVAACGTRASARFPLSVEVGQELPFEGTLAQMARLQGNAGFRSAERRVMAADYAKTENGWRIAGMRFEAV